MKKPTRSQAMLALFLASSFSILITSVAVWVIIGMSGDVVKTTFDQRLLTNLTRVVPLATVEDISTITKPEDVEKPLYAELKERLNLLAKTNQLARTYFARKTADGRLQYIVDSVYGKESEGIATRPIDPRDAREILRQAFSGQIVVQALGMYTEDAEGIISGYAPIYGDDGDVVAIAGVDLSDLTAVQLIRFGHIAGGMIFLSAILTIISGSTMLVSYRRAADSATTALTDLRNATNLIIENEKFAALGSLVAGIAHEVNTPLGVSVTAASYLGEITETLVKSFEAGTVKKVDFAHFTASCQETTGIILSNLNRAAGLIQSFKRIAVDQSDENRQTILLKDYLQDIIIALTPKLKKTKIRIVINCPETLMVSTMPGALSQIVTNLVTNSIMHAFAPDEAGEVTISATTENNILKLNYTDNGKGIPAGNMPRIFEPFFTTRRGQGGSGLGLNLVHTLVTQGLKGRIELSSTEGRGVRFMITLPDCALKV